MKKQRIKQTITLFLAITILLCLGFLLYWYVREQEFYGSGWDVWGHMFKTDLMYQNMKEGILYPLYTTKWYNGLQPYRYWAPFPYYITAILQGIAGGNVIEGYYLFALFSYVFGGFAFVLWGISSKRMLLCTIFGALWFFFPENFRVYFCEGNLPRMVTTILIPYLIYFIWLYLKKNRTWAMVGVIAFMSLMTLSHVMIAAMMGVGTFIYLFFYCLSNQCFKKGIEVLVGMILSFALCGVWLFPALIGGLVGMDSDSSSTVMESLTYNFTTSLNPMNRINGVTDTFYYGISFVLLSFLGILLSKRKEKAGYCTTMVIMLLTTPAVVPILLQIPLSEVLWMMRFATIGYGFFLLSFVEWSNLKKRVCIVFVGFLIIDSLPSLWFERYFTPVVIDTSNEIKVLKENTTNRTTFLDMSKFGSFPSYWICVDDENQAVDYSYGWAWQGASTASNIVMLNTALEKEDYVYAFDRCIEMGNDTVVVKSTFIGGKGKTEEELLYAANLSGYELIYQSVEAYVFHKDTPDTFGVKTIYDGMAIGKYAYQIELIYPNFTHGESYYLDDYTVEELSEYNMVFLSGMEYHDRQKAENLVKELANQGIEVMIDMSNIPEDKLENRHHFLGVYAQNISFDGVYPTLYLGEKKVNTMPFAKEYRNWNTVFIEGTKQVIGSAYYQNNESAFLGTDETGNIFFVGYNLVFHAIETGDEQVIELINTCLDIEDGQIPNRTLVPLEVMFDEKKNEIVIKSKETEINTTLAYQDNFESENRIEKSNNLLTVYEPVTTIQIKYPYFKKGMVVTIVGIIMIIGFFIYLVEQKRRS